MSGKPGASDRKVGTSAVGFLVPASGIISWLLLFMDPIATVAILAGIALAVLLRFHKGNESIQAIRNLALLIFVFAAGYVVFGIVFMHDSVSSQKVEAGGGVPQQLSITYPDYVKNPEAFLVDREDKISSQIPLKTALWVEDVIDANTIRVSYATTQAGTNIIDTQALQIPGLTSLLSGCAKDEAQKFFSQNLLHTEVYLVERTGTIYEAGWTLLMPQSNGRDTVDVAVFAVSSGFGSARSAFDTDNPLYRKYSFAASVELKKMEEVASLAKRGMWAICTV